MKTLSAIWRMITASIRLFKQNIDREIRAEQERAIARRMRKETGALVLAKQNARIQEQNECSHRHFNGDLACTLLADSIANEPAAICVHCQKIITYREHPALYNDIASFGHGCGSSKKNPLHVPENDWLYEMPLEKLEKLANAPPVATPVKRRRK